VVSGLFNVYRLYIYPLLVESVSLIAGGMMLKKLINGLIAFSTWFVPSSFSIAVMLTVIAVVLAISLTPSSIFDCVSYWGNGFWALLKFAMQMCLIVYTGYIVAVSKPIRRLLELISDVPKTPRQAIAMMAFVSMSMCWINWGMGLIASAVFAVILAKKHKNVNYKLLVACSYLGMGVTWHAGLSGSVPLLLATPGNFLESTIGIVPVSETIFSPFNLLTTAVIAIVILSIAVFLHSKKGEGESTLNEDMNSSKIFEFIPPVLRKKTLAGLIDGSPILNILFGMAGVLYLGNTFYHNGFSLTLNNVNLMFLTFGIILHRTPASLIAASAEAGKVLHGIVLQFPLYAGIYGIIKDSGLAVQISHFFIGIASAETFPTIVCWYSSILNYFVPSGGSKWAIEAPYLLDAARHLGVGVNKVAMAYAMGDMSSNLIQPFWSIPLLSVAGLKFRDILGYGILFFTVYIVLASGALFIFLR